MTVFHRIIWSWCNSQPSSPSKSWAVETVSEVFNSSCRGSTCRRQQLHVIIARPSPSNRWLISERPRLLLRSFLHSGCCCLVHLHPSLIPDVLRLNCSACSELLQLRSQLVERGSNKRTQQTSLDPALSSPLSWRWPQSCWWCWAHYERLQQTVFNCYPEQVTCDFCWLTSEQTEGKSLLRQEEV